MSISTCFCVVFLHISLCLSFRASFSSYARSLASLTFSRFVSFRSSAPEVDVPFVLCFALAFFFVFCHGQHRRLGFGRVYAMRVWVCFTNEFSTQTWTTMLRFFGLNLSTDSAESKWEAVLGSLNLWFFSFLHWRRFFFSHTKSQISGKYLIFFAILCFRSPIDSQTTHRKYWLNRRVSSASLFWVKIERSMHLSYVISLICGIVSVLVVSRKHRNNVSQTRARTEQNTSSKKKENNQMQISMCKLKPISHVNCVRTMCGAMKWKLFPFEQGISRSPLTHSRTYNSPPILIKSANNDKFRAIIVIGSQQN